MRSSSTRRGFSETTWLRQHEGKGVDPFLLRGEQEEKRDMRIATSLSGFFHACGSALDALASTTIGVGGLKADLVTAGWPTITDAKEPEKLFASPGTDARILQDELMAAILGAFDVEPHGWLSWMLSMRHLLVHRAQRFDMRSFYRGKPRDALQFDMRLPKNPQLTDVRSVRTREPA